MASSNEEAARAHLEGFVLEQQAAQCLMEGQIQEGFEAATEAAELNPKSWRAWALKGEAACSFPEPHAELNIMMAIGVLEKALSLEPDDEQARAACQQRLEWARDMLDLPSANETSAESEDVSPLLDETERLLSQGQTQAAFEKACEATKRDSSSVRAWILQADSLHALEVTMEINQASEVVCLERALELGVSDEQRTEIQGRVAALKRVVSREAITTARDFIMLQNTPF